MDGWHGGGGDGSPAGRDDRSRPGTADRSADSGGHRPWADDRRGRRRRGRFAVLAGALVAVAVVVAGRAPGGDAPRRPPVAAVGADAPDSAARPMPPEPSSAALAADGDADGRAPAVVAPAPAPTATPTPTPTYHVVEDGYHVWARNDDGSPVRWNPCEPIRWVLNPDGAPPGAVADVTDAMRRIGAVTGLRFHYDGTTREAPRRDRRPYQPKRYGEDRWAPVLVAWVAPSRTDVRLGARDRAVAVPVAVGFGVDDAFVTGQIVLNARKQLAQGFGDRHASWGATLVHELGHLVGLDHVDDPRELMYVHPGFGPVEFGPGDRRGLTEVGAAAGCIDPPDPAHVEVHYEDDFGR